jgi:hypothetical protein
MPEPEPPPKKKPRLAPGKFARRSGLLHRGCSSMRQGPTSLEQLMNWPQRLCQDIWDGSIGELRRARTAANLAAGLVLAGEYSGELCAETAIRMQVMGMASNGLTIPLDRIISYSACEINHMCRRLILQSRHPPLHLFSSVLNFVKPSDGEELFKRGPPKYEAKGDTRAEDARRLEEAMAAFQEQFDYFSSHSKTIFTGKRKAKCLTHGKECPIFWQTPSDASVVPKEDWPITWNWSGAICKPWSAMGGQKKLADPATQVWNVWVANAACSPNDMVTLENSNLMPARIFKDSLDEFAPGKWLMVGLLVNCLRQGWPYNRHRSYRTAVNSETMVWLGPPVSEPDAIQRHFDSIFDCTTVLDGDIFLGSTEADVQEEKEMRYKLAASQGVYTRDGSVPAARHCLSRCERRHFDQYGVLFGDTKPGEAFIADLSQNLDARRRYGPRLRAYCTSSVNYSYSQDKFFSQRAARRAHGWPAPGSQAHDLYGECLPHDWDKTSISFSQSQLVIGQGMQLGEVGAVFLYILAHTLRRDLVVTMIPVPRPVAAAHAEGFEED